MRIQQEINIWLLAYKTQWMPVALCSFPVGKCHKETTNNDMGTQCEGC